MSKKIKFKVIHVLGEDEKCKANELEYHGPSVQGWLSSKNCIFPQQVVILLNTAAFVQQIQILAHHCIIPEQIDIWVGPEQEDERDEKEQPIYKYVGFVTLDNNEKTKFRCRELKTVSIPSLSGPTRYIKFMIHQNYSNELNIYNQVAIVAIQVIGKECRNIYQINSNTSTDVAMISENGVIFDDLAFEMYVDKEVGHILKILDEKKKMAVKDERFEYARKIKFAMAELHLAGEKLGKLQIAKNQAIQQEDYSRAKRKKSQIDEFKLQLYDHLHIEDLLEKHGAIPKNDDDVVITEEEDFNVILPEKELQTYTLSKEGNVKSTQMISVHSSPIQSLLIESHVQISGNGCSGNKNIAPEIRRPSTCFWQRTTNDGNSK